MFALMRSGARYGILIFGWGSCSACDALQACRNWEEVAALRDDIARGIRWFESAGDALAYVREHDWSLEWTWSMMGPRRKGAPWIRTPHVKFHGLWCNLKWGPRKAQYWRFITLPAPRSRQQAYFYL